jgi:hypothetical protein
MSPPSLHISSLVANQRLAAQPGGLRSLRVVTGTRPADGEEHQDSIVIDAKRRATKRGRERAEKGSKSAPDRCLLMLYV